MRKIFTIAAIAVSVAGFSQAPKPFTIKGSIQNFQTEGKRLFLTYRASGVTVKDSVEPRNGTYNFEGRIAEPIRAQLFLKPILPGAAPQRINDRDIATVFLAPSDIQVISTDSFSNVVVKGSKAHDEFLKIQAAMKPYNEKENELDKQYMAFEKAKDEAGKSSIMAQYKSLNKEANQVYANYLKANPKSPIALYVINQFAGYDINPDEVDPLFKALPASVKNLPSYKELNDRMVIARKIGIGKQAMDFTQNDTLGNPVSLSSLKGKYVLVDFWASWCGPCRRENPNVVTAFNKYKDKGFTVLGVSLDQPGAKARWIKAIHDDGLTWTHVSDLKYWDNDVAKLYGVRAIPFNLLLDKNGKILAKNIRGEELQSKLAEILQ